MTTSRYSNFFRSVLALVFSCGVVSVGNAFAEQSVIPVDYSVELEHGDWIPIEPEDMERAAVDAALTRLSDANRLEIGDRVESSDESDSERGHLGFSLRLIGRAETLQLTIRLDLRGAPTAIATTAVSVAQLDHRGIFEAFEHAGRTSAERLLPNLHGAARSGSGSRSDSRTTVSRERKALFDSAQQAKRARRFEDASELFGRLAVSKSDQSDGYSDLAQDELRYGLPVFEAQQLLNDVASVMGSPSSGNRGDLMARAEHLYRQIEAENVADPQRVAEAQRAIDQLLVSRKALANAVRVSMLSRASIIRLGLAQTVMMEGACPDMRVAEGIVAQSRGNFLLEDISGDRAGPRVYTLSDPASGLTLELECDRDGVNYVDPHGPRRSRPASPRPR